MELNFYTLNLKEKVWILNYKILVGIKVVVLVLPSFENQPS